MTDHDNTQDTHQAELVAVLNRIHAELQQLNQTMSRMASSQSSASVSPPPSRSYGPPRERAPREGGYRPAPRTRTLRDEAISDDERPGGSDTIRKKKPAGRPKGSLPPKKGSGYPKRPR